MWLIFCVIQGKISIFINTRLTIAKDSNASIIATFSASCNATVGDVSTIVVTATSSLDGTQNSAVTRLIVTSDVSSLHVIKLSIPFNLKKHL